jgi:hypothetical protein
MPLARREELSASLIVFHTAVIRRTVMGHASIARAVVKTTAVAGAAVFLSTSAQAGLRLGPGALLGLLGAPLRMMPHIGGVPEHREFHHHHVAHAQDKASAAAPEPADRPASAPAAQAAPPQPANQPAKPPVVEARAEPAHTAEPRQPPPSALAWPVASPSVYQDLLGYVLWPGDYADRLWSHGYGDIIDTVLASTAANADQTASAIQNGMCSTKASELADALIVRTGNIIMPTPDQKAALDQLAAALGEAINRGRTAVCSGTGGPLNRVEDGLWTMWDATLLMRAPLEKFYDSLSAAQKAKLTAGAAAGQAVARACADPRAADGPDDSQHTLLEHARAADAQQRGKLEALRQESPGLIKFLAISCPTETKATPVDRLEAAGDRMNALLYVVMNMSPALTGAKTPSVPDR